MKSNSPIFTVSLILGLCFLAGVHSWGFEGHKAVAELAYSQLTDEAKQVDGHLREGGRVLILIIFLSLKSFICCLCCCY